MKGWGVSLEDYMSRKKTKRERRRKEVLQEALDLFDKAMAGDVDAIIKIWEIYLEDDEIGGDENGN